MTCDKDRGIILKDSKKKNSSKKTHLNPTSLGDRAGEQSTKKLSTSAKCRLGELGEKGLFR